MTSWNKNAEISVTDKKKNETLRPIRIARRMPRGGPVSSKSLKKILFFH